MAANRFKVTSVPEPTRKNPTTERPEKIPLIHVESEILSPTSVSTYISPSNGKTKNRSSSRIYNKILQRRSSDIRRRATIAAATDPDNNEFKKSSSADAISQADSKSRVSLTTSLTDAPIGSKVEESDTYSTVHSNYYDTNQKSITNKFLQEIRLKRREIREKAKNISIDQRIAFNRRENQRKILHVRDIFDVHFEPNDEDYNAPIVEPTIFTEEYQEKVRNDIYNELNRQRKKQHDRQYRQLILGRALLMVMIALLTYMSILLIFYMSNTLSRLTSLITNITDNQFVPMNSTERINLY